jgi:UDP-N-acetyl-D-glucosamine dehydrogenase
MKVGIVGLGYVGLPLALGFGEAGHEVVGVDTDSRVVETLRRGESHVEDVSDELLRGLGDRFRATTRYQDLAQVEAILVAAPTPLTRNREPDLGPLVAAGTSLASVLQQGQLVVLESTTYPGTTRERFVPLLEESGLAAGKDFHAAYSPERIDPGRTDFTLRTTPKIVGGLTDECLRRAVALYELVCDEVVPVSTPEAAELTKLLENVFRSVNIALVNEMAQLCERMKIDFWEVVDAAATKPFGFMSFKPGPGLGGHCIPIDPFYLTWKAREYDFYTEFIELAGKVNENMPWYCRSLISQALNHGKQKSLKGSEVLVLGVAYKPNIGDMRESPALKLIELLETGGANVSFHDQHVAELPEHGLTSVPLEPAKFDAIAIVTDHSGIDYEALVDSGPVIVDFRNATGERGRTSENVWKL